MGKWEIVTQSKPMSTEAKVDIGFLGVTIFQVTLSCSQYLYKKSNKEKN